MGLDVGRSRREQTMTSVNTMRSPWLVLCTMTDARLGGAVMLGVTCHGTLCFVLQDLTEEL